ncbi:MAG: Aspartokinase [Candidatus Peregrinibacteria bacterium GW2011_GWA2_47_7]|nr:MAG: Aspartokinase [Candidatus Peregrinibacteria bacterium GW2011_GWA2_47_7]
MNTSRMNLIVAKFGGTSMGSAEAITGVANILKNLDCPRVAVVSAVSGITDMLIGLGALTVKQSDWREEFVRFQSRHEDIIKNLDVAVDLKSFYDELERLLNGIALLQELSPSVKDHLVSFGERMSSVILAEFLKTRGIIAERIDAKELVMTDNNYTEANVRFEETNACVERRLRPLLDKGIVPVLTGFIGKSAEGKYATLGRGGSDYSGAIIAAALGAQELHIWTDVDGIYSSDPRVIKGATVIEKLSFDEAAELAYFGAKVLHPKTIHPAIKEGIPVRVLNTFRPTAKGTLIVDEESRELKSVTWRKGVTVVNICSTRMLGPYGFLAKIFDLFAQHHVAIDVLATSEVSVSLTIDSEPPQILLDQLSEFSTVTVEPHFAIVCLVGGGIKDMKDVLGRLFTAVSAYPVKMVSQGASKRNITFLVEESVVAEVGKKVFHEFFNSPEHV